MEVEDKKMTQEMWTTVRQVHGVLGFLGTLSHPEVFKLLGKADEMLEAKELVNLVQTLSPMYRLVFNLHVLEGLKHREIAALLGISEGTSKSNLSDARAILQKHLTVKKKLAV